MPSAAMRSEPFPLMTALCHCTTCRRATGAPAVAWAMFKEEQVTFAGRRPAEYASSGWTMFAHHDADKDGFVSKDDPVAKDEN